MALLLASGSWWRVHSLRQSRLVIWERILAGNATFTRNAVHAWFLERDLDAGILATNTGMLTDSPGADDSSDFTPNAALAQLSRMLTATQHSFGYDGAWAFDRTGRVLAEAQHATADAATAPERALAVDVARTRSPRVTDASLDAQGDLILTYFRPVFPYASSDSFTIAHSIGLRVNVSKALQSVLGERGTAATISSMLVARSGDHLVILAPETNKTKLTARRILGDRASHIAWDAAVGVSRSGLSKSADGCFHSVHLVHPVQVTFAVRARVPLVAEVSTQSDHQVTNVKLFVGKGHRNREAVTMLLDYEQPIRRDKPPIFAQQDAHSGKNASGQHITLRANSRFHQSEIWKR